MLKAMNIQWDTDGDENLAKELPPCIEIPPHIADNVENLDDENEVISDYISNLTGFCHFGFKLIEE